MSPALTARRVIASLTAAITVSGLLVATPALAAGGDSTIRASVKNDGTQASGGFVGSGFASLASADNTDDVVFWSDHKNLVGTQTANHIYLRRAGATSLVDVATGNPGTVGDGNADTASISADGTKIAFSSSASNLAAGDSNEFMKVFLRDTTTNTTTRLSSVLAVSPNGDSWYPSISRNGNVVAFSSNASNLSTGDTNGEPDVFTATTDGPTPTVARVSVGTAGEQANGGSGAPSLSDDGRYVAFSSGASNLVTGDTNGETDVFVRDTQANTTVRVSVASDGAQGGAGLASGISSSIGISGTGRFIVFDSRADLAGLGATVQSVYLHDRDADENGTFDETAAGKRNTRLISVSAANGTPLASESMFPLISGDGSLIAYRTADSAALPANTAANATMNVVLVERYIATGGLLSFRSSLLSTTTADAQPVDQTLLPTDLERVPDGAIRASWLSREAFDPTDTDGIGDVYVRTIVRPTAPSIVTPSAGQLVKDAVVVSGTAAKGSRVELYSGIAGSVGAVKVSETQLAGIAEPEAFSFPVTVSDDEHTYSAVAVRAGVVSPVTSVTFIVDRLRPTTSVSFPVDGGRYASAHWGVGACTSGLCGTASDQLPPAPASPNAQTNVEEVKFSVQRGATGPFLNGGSFSAVTEAYTVASTAHPITTWTAALPFFPDGTYTVRTYATDKAGNGQAPGTVRTFTTDSTPPTITLTSPVDGSTVGDRRPVLKGLGGLAAGDLGTMTLEIFAGTGTGGALLASYPVTRNATTGAFEGAPAADLADGTYTARARQQDDVQNAGVSPTSTFTVDGSLPRVAISDPLEGGGVGDVTPLITGTASHASVVTVDVFAGTTVSGAPQWSGTATPAAGQWSAEVTPALVEGTYTVRASQTNGIGTAMSVPVTFVVNLTTPVVSIAAPIHDAWLGTSTPIVNGTASAGTNVSVKIYVGTSASGEPLQSHMASVSGGTWSTTLSALDEMAYTIVASQTVTPNTGTAAATIHVDLSNPTGVVEFPSAPPAGFNAASLIAGCETPSVGDVCGTVTDAPSGVVSLTYAYLNVDSMKFWNGSTGFNSATPVYANASAVLPSTSGQPLGWSAPLDPAILTADAQYSVILVATDCAGRQATFSRNFAYDNNLALPQINTPLTGQYFNTGTVLIAGTAEPGALVTVWEGVTMLTAAPIIAAPVTGAWSFTTTRPEGVRSIHARAQDIGANIALSPSRTFTIDLTAPAAPTISSPIDQAFIAVSAVSIVGAAEPGSTVHVFLDGVAVTSTVAGPTGSYLAALSGLSNGLHTVKARSEDLATNIGAFSSTVRFTIDTSSPVAPLISTPGHGSTVVGPVVGIGGLGEPGSVVRVREGATQIASAVVSAGGGWHVNVSLALGAHTVTARQTDAAGNESATAAPLTFTVIGAVANTTISSPLENQVLGSRDLVVSGLAAASASVQLSLSDGQGGFIALGSVGTANGSGSWAIPIRLGEGTHSIRAAVSGGSVSALRTFKIESGIPTFTSPAANAFVSRPFVVRGTAKPGASVSIVLGATTVGTASADGSGLWAATLTIPEGSRTLIAYAGSGQQRTENSDSLTVRVDASGPALAVSPSSGVMGAGGTAKLVSGAANDLSGVVSVSLTYRNILTGASVAATGVVCTGCGTTSVTFTHVPTLPSGYWTVEATATDLAGNVGRAGASFVMTV